jgi:hypothetical protein
VKVHGAPCVFFVIIDNTYELISSLSVFLVIIHNTYELISSLSCIVGIFHTPVLKDKVLNFMVYYLEIRTSIDLKTMCWISCCMPCTSMDSCVDPWLINT